MMYNEKLIVAVKASGRILREHKDAVYVPFGTEYTLLVKNLNTVRALVRIEIDGENMTDSGLVLEAGESADIERSIKNGNLTSGNRFKFIERTAQIEAGPRGIKSEDGIIRVVFEFERVVQPYVNSPFYIGTPYKSDMFGSTAGSPQPSYNSTSGKSHGVLRSRTAGASTYDIFSYGTSTCSDMVHDSYMPKAQSANSTQAIVNQVADVGITVPGSVSDQVFTLARPVVSDGIKHVLVLRLLGEVAGAQVKQAVTVKHKPKCVTCGTVNKAGSKFCSSCGTSLTIV